MRCTIELQAGQAHGTFLADGTNFRLIRDLTLPLKKAKADTPALWGAHPLEFRTNTVIKMKITESNSV